MANSIIVTGGAGFIGSNLVAELNRRGEDNILIVDDLAQTEKWKNLVGLSFADYIDKDSFRTLIEKGGLELTNAVFHMGACSSTTEPNASYLMDNNYRYTRELCTWCLEKNIRFIYASSAATYGDGSLGYSDADERTPHLEPLNMYGYSKHLFDVWAIKQRLHNQIVGLKYFNVFGPCEDHKEDMRSVVHKAYGQILDSGEVHLFKSYKPEYKDGEQVRDFIYVKDAVDVTLYFYEHPDESGLFNCGTGQARTWVDLVRGVFSAMDRTPNIRFMDMPRSLKGKYQYHTEAEISKLRQAGYQKEFTRLEEGIRDYVQSSLT
ncbi:MAG: ADP-glyceromanno-heptose 6-epimerase [Kiritimatiellae bacterium]|nr:ADP-glyceromanno-heptose 6-epimerase [Kiritimatiellia bacterium]